MRPGGPDFLAVDDEFVADNLGAGSQRGEIRTGARLGIALAPDLLGGQDFRQIAFFLLVGSP